MQRKLKDMNTHPAIITAFTRILREGVKNYKIEPMTLTTEDDTLIVKAATDQINLGHLSLEKGYISKAWAHLQDLWNKQEGITKLHKEQWAAKSIEALHEYSTDMWKLRNTCLHKTNKKVLQAQ